jgi:hypothetical protein
MISPGAPNKPTGQNSGKNTSVEQQLLDSVLKRLGEYKALGDRVLAQLPSEALHHQPAENVNNIAVIIKHLHGNMLSRWTNFLTEDGEKSWRNRDAEFEVGNESKEDLVQLWEAGWQTLMTTLESLEPADLQRNITIRNESLPVVDAIIRQVAHYSGHVGQIIYAAKCMQGADWQSLTISLGGSQAFNQQMKHQQ